MAFLTVLLTAVALVSFLGFRNGPTVITVRSGATTAEIQRALNSLPMEGGEVFLPTGIFDVTEPIVLARDNLVLRGTGKNTVLRLANNANCPVIIMGQPVNKPTKTLVGLHVTDLLIDGNRRNQQRELWKPKGEGSEIRNNGITVQSLSDSSIEHVVTARCRSGGVVTTLGVRRLTVHGLNSYDNQFDGLACYLTEDSVFEDLYLHDNPGAGISLDLSFNHNTIRKALLSSNDLGIFMRSSHSNQFKDVSIENCHHFGVFIAHTDRRTDKGWSAAPNSECANNLFSLLRAANCGSAAVRINNLTCTNNVIAEADFAKNIHGGLSLAQPN